MLNADELRQAIDQELKQLPTPRAPETLLPRVLAATVARASARWYARPWLTWPRGWQIASVAVLVALGIAVSTFISYLLSAPAGAAAHAPGRVRQIVVAIEQATTLMHVLWQVLLGPAALWLLIVAVSLSLACAAIWSALERAAVGGASQQ